MRLSSGFGGLDLVGGAVAQHCVEHVDAAACERDDGLVVGLSFDAFAAVEGLAGGVGERAERRHRGAKQPFGFSRFRSYRDLPEVRR